MKKNIYTMILMFLGMSNALAMEGIVVCLFDDENGQETTETYSYDTLTSKELAIAKCKEKNNSVHIFLEFEDLGPEG